MESITDDSAITYHETIDDEAKSKDEEAKEFQQILMKKNMTCICLFINYYCIFDSCYLIKF